VLLLVGSFEPFDQAEAERVNADGFLTKPFTSVRDLVARVKDLLGHAPSPAASLENDDIDDLYKSSFAQNVRIDEFETADDPLGDQLFDDEMIEASSPVVTSAESGVAQNSATATAEHAREFDWSPDAVVTPSDSVNTQASPVENAPVAIEQSVSFENNDGTTAAAVGFATEADLPLQETSVPQTTEADVAEPSSEFISLVAQLVVEKLSDRVIREIAQDAVPRIAERLMREALEQDKKE
jgi:hypothetical protein